MNAVSPFAIIAIALGVIFLFFAIAGICLISLRAGRRSRGRRPADSGTEGLLFSSQDTSPTDGTTGGESSHGPHHGHDSGGHTHGGFDGGGHHGGGDGGGFSGGDGGGGHSGH